MRNPESRQGSARHQERPLYGVRVLDFSRSLAGLMATMLLAAQGADVIAVDALDEDCAGSRSNAPSPNVNCGKRSLAIDIRRPDGMSVVRRLLRSADAIVHDFQPDTAEVLGLDPEAVRTLRPDIVYVVLGGFFPGNICMPNGTSGQVNPVTPTGNEVQTGAKTVRRPETAGSVPDSTKALLAHQAIVTALLARDRSGEGHCVNLTLLDGALAFLWPDRMGELEPNHAAPEVYGAHRAAVPERDKSRPETRSHAHAHAQMHELIDIFGFSVAARAPASGEHTIDLLRELGYTEISIDSLIQDGVVLW